MPIPNRRATELATSSGRFAPRSRVRYGAALRRSVPVLSLVAVALLAGLMTGPRGAGLRDVGAVAGADPVRDMTYVQNRAGEPA